MSTNYYWKPDPESRYHELAQIHIGLGWRKGFLFKEHFFSGREPSTEFLEIAPGVSLRISHGEVPSILIQSFDEWEKFLQEEIGSIYDEYDRPILLDNFLIIVKSYPKHTLPEAEYLDKDGYNFCRSNFS